MEAAMCPRSGLLRSPSHQEPPVTKHIEPGAKLEKCHRYMRSGSDLLGTESGNTRLRVRSL